MSSFPKNVQQCTHTLTHTHQQVSLGTQSDADGDLRQALLWKSKCEELQTEYVKLMLVYV